MRSDYNNSRSKKTNVNDLKNNQINIKTTDSSIGRADDCRGNIVIVRSCVQFTLGGIFNKHAY